MNRVIRRAGPADAEALARIGASTFTETFGHMYAEEDLRSFLAENHSVSACARLLADPASAVWVVEDDGVAVGHALAGRCGLPHPEVAPGDGELKRLYLLGPARNGGWGGHLLDAALAWLERDGPRTLWISVWSENVAAQRFYARRGFANSRDRWCEVESA